MKYGYELLSESLRQHGVEVIFHLMGGPMIDAANTCESAGIKLVDVRHEQAAVMMAHAYSRVGVRPGVAMTCSGPGTTNAVTGMANAFVDGSPVILLGGSVAVKEWGREGFQEMDQLAMMEPITRWSVRVHEARRIPEIVDQAFAHAFGARPGPVYIDLPGDVLYQQIEDEQVVRRSAPSLVARRQASRAHESQVELAVQALAAAARPVVICGSGVMWSGAGDELASFIERARTPMFTSPQARGLVPDDHKLVPLAARSVAFREADLVLVVGHRLNYMLGFGAPPRFAADAKWIQIDIDPVAIASTRAIDIPLLGDAKAILGQLTEAYDAGAEEGREEWLSHLAEVHAQRTEKQEAAMASDSVPIHPLRLCKEVRDFLDRDSILCVDGLEILNYGRQSIPTYVGGHRLNSGPFGTMGVGLPFGLGAQVANPDAQVVVLHGDGSLGFNLMELDTAVRFSLNVITVVSNNGGWGATDRYKAGRALAFTRYDEVAKGLGCHGEFVEDPTDIRPALERAAASGLPALVNVITDPGARGQTAKFTSYMT